MNNTTPQEYTMDFEKNIKRVNIYVGILAVLYYIGLLIFQSKVTSVQLSVSFYAASVFLAVFLNLFTFIRHVNKGWKKEQIEIFYIYLISQTLLPLPFLALSQMI